MGANQQMMLASAAGVGTTWNPADKTANWSLSNGNLTATTTSATPTPAQNGCRGTTSKSAGAWYYEVHIDSQGSSIFYTPALGIATGSFSLTATPGNSGSYALSSTGQKGALGSFTAYGTSFTTGDVIMCALNMGTTSIWWGKNGTWYASGNPAAGTGAAFTNVAAGSYFPLVGYNNGIQVVTARFSTGFSYSVPSGFSAWG